MNDTSKMNLCLKLLKSDSEHEIISILEEYDFWNKDEVWMDFGGNESNFSVIGAQQKYPEKALVEKIINSVDAVLMRECLKSGIIPESEDAPQSIEQALEEFFNIRYGKLSSLTATQRTELAENIGVIATGEKSLPCYSIIDKGEGQTPKMLPETILSILKSNKLRIPFVQGRFNMGGTGALRFCGKNNFQLVISRRDPEIVQKEGNDGSSDFWGFTIVRRFRPSKGMRNSVYKYLAPGGKIPQFKAEFFPIFPNKEEPYKENLEFGTLIKLYEYELTSSLRTNILFDMYNRLSLLLPSIALPIRLYERRGYLGHSLETTLAGLNVRLDEDKYGNIEEGFPSSESVIIDGQKLYLQIYAFKRDENRKSRKLKYASKDGIILIVDGQSHGFYNKQFFSRKSVGMGYLEDYILITIDCSDLSESTREDLFMNTRDRLSDCQFKEKLDNELTLIIKNHQGLKDLREKRKRENLERRISDDQPFSEVLQDIVKKSPSLTKLFIKGENVKTPFDLTEAQPKTDFKGEQFPSYFVLHKDFPKENPKQYYLKERVRIQFETDAENNYFAREDYPGEFTLFFNDVILELTYARINLWKGIATLNMEIPPRYQIGDKVEVRLEVTDPSKIEPFSESFFIEINKQRESKGGTKGKRKETVKEGEGERKEPRGLSLPRIIEIRKEDWQEFDFNEESVMHIFYDPEEGYTFNVNMHNKYLLTEIKGLLTEDIETEIYNSQFKYGMVLLALSILRMNEESEYDNDLPIYNEIYKTCEGIAPVLIPLISYLSELEINE